MKRLVLQASERELEISGTIPESGAEQISSRGRGAGARGHGYYDRGGIHSSDPGRGQPRSGVCWIRKLTNIPPCMEFCPVCTQSPAGNRLLLRSVEDRIDSEVQRMQGGAARAAKEEGSCSSSWPRPRQETGRTRAPPARRGERLRQRLGEDHTRLRQPQCSPGRFWELLVFSEVRPEMRAP